MGGNNRFLDGVLWGILIGGTIVFLLGTKKGNKVLKTITEEGSQSLSNIMEDIEQAVEDAEEEVSSDDEDESEKSKVNNFSDNHFQEISKIKGPSRNSSEEKKVRRFFKTSKKQ